MIAAGAAVLRSLVPPLAVLGLMPAFAITRFIRALMNKCDLATAQAKMPKDVYRGKVCFITGASSGLGAEFARQLGFLGAKLILSARTVGALEDLRTSIIAAGASPADVTVMRLDVSELSGLPAATARACAFYGGVDLLINNAGFSQREMAVNTDFGVTESMTAVDYLACVALAQALLAPMEARGGGRILNISSVAGKVGVPLRTSYCGSKFAVIGYFDSLRVEEYARGSGISITNACPGSVRTNLARNAMLGTGQLRGESDANIDAGLEPAWACERILAATACGLDEVWIARPKELVLAYLNQYLPTRAKRQLEKMAKGMMQATLATTVGKDQKVA